MKPEDASLKARAFRRPYSVCLGLVFAGFAVLGSAAYGQGRDRWSALPPPVVDETLFNGPIVTTIEKHETFYPAEAYRQDYMANSPGDPYIVINDLPKIRALEPFFPHIYRQEPVLVSKAYASSRSGK